MRDNMNDVITLDLETIPNESKIHLLPEPKLNAKLVNPQKIAEDIKKKKTKQLEEMGLDANFANICCVSFRDKDKASTLSPFSITMILSLVSSGESSMFSSPISNSVLLNQLYSSVILNKFSEVV